MSVKFSYLLSIFVFSYGCSNLTHNNNITEGTNYMVETQSIVHLEKPFKLEVETFNYAIKGKDSLALDLYWNHNQIDASPLVIFVHGGGFYTGTRKEENIDLFCRDICERGFAVANIDYRLHLKGQSFHCDQPSANKIKAFEVCVNDIRSATEYLTSEQNACLIESTQVFLIGSSAGAEAVLHAINWRNSEYTEGNPPILEDGFQYKGVVSMAGAMIDTSLITQENLIPHMLFHGTCDPLVPYASDIHHYCPENSVGGLMLHGSLSIMERIEHLNGSFQLFSYCGDGHKVASIPLSRHKEDIENFLNNCLENAFFQDHQILKENNTPCKYGENHAFCN